MRKPSLTSNTWAFLGILAGLLFLGAILIMLLPAYARSGLMGGLGGFLGFLGWFIPWLLFQAWVILAAVLLLVGPAIAARYWKLLVYKVDKRYDPMVDFGPGMKWVVYIGFGVMVLFVAWLVFVPSWLIVKDGWYWLLVSAAGYNAENLHWTSAIWALAVSIIWFSLSSDDGSMNIK